MTCLCGCNQAAPFNDSTSRSNFTIAQRQQVNCSILSLAGRAGTQATFFLPADLEDDALAID